MTQLDPSRYRKFTTSSPEYGKSYGLYWDSTNSQLVLALNDTVVARVDATGITADLEFSSEAQGDILRRAASAWERYSAKTSGQILVGDGTDVVSVAVSGDATLTSAGALTVTDVTVGSDAAGDMLYKSSATALARLAKGTAGQVMVMNSGATAPSWVSVSGDATIDATGALTVTDVTVGSDAAGDIQYKSSGTALARLAKGTAGQYLQMNTGATAPEWDTVKAHWSMRVPAASGKDTDYYKGGIAGSAVTGDLTATEAGATYCQNFDTSASSYAAIETGSAGDFVQWQIFPNNTQDNDACYFGATIPFCEMWLDLSATVATYTGDALTWEYGTAAGWSTLTLAHDYTDATAQDGKRSFGRDGAISFVPPSDWASKTVNSVAAYWIRARVSTVANLDAARGLLNSKRHYLVTPTDGWVVPHACTITNVAIRDEAATVHAANPVVFEVVNFTTGAHSGALTFAVSKRFDNFASITLSCAANDVLGVLISTEDGTNEIGPFTIEMIVTLV